MRIKYNRNSHLEPKFLEPLTLTLIGSCKGRKRVPIKAITKQYVIVAVDDGEEQVYEIPSGIRALKKLESGWYHIGNRSLERIISFVKGFK